MYGKRSTFLLSALCFGMAFLYVPIFLLVGYSFNYSKIVPLWGGFSTRWYTVLFQSEEMWTAAALSIKIAVVSASFATIFGTLAGLALVRFGRFRGRTLFTGMISAPLVMPEVITGLSLLLLFIGLQQLTGWPGSRGFTTITIAHITFSMAYVAVIIQSRLTGMGQDLEEAAQDLGAKPLRVLTDITLPLLAPAMIAGWLLAFTLSMDDLVISVLPPARGKYIAHHNLFAGAGWPEAGYQCVGNNYDCGCHNWRGFGLVADATSGEASTERQAAGGELVRLGRQFRLINPLKNFLTRE